MILFTVTSRKLNEKDHNLFFFEKKIVIQSRSTPRRYKNLKKIKTNKFISYFNIVVTRNVCLVSFYARFLYRPYFFSSFTIL